MSYEQQTEASAQPVCVERGFKTTGSKEVLETAGGASAQRKRARDVQETADALLLAACETGSLDDALSTIRDGGSVNCANDDGWTPLMLACHRSDWGVAEPVVRALLERKALVRVASVDGSTALHIAAQSSRPTTVAMLLEAGALVDARSSNLRTPLHCCCLRDSSDDDAIAELLLDAICNTARRLSHCW